MATNRILSNAKEFVKSLDAAALEIHKQTMIGMSEWVDKVRANAVKQYMVPNKYVSSTVVRNRKNGDLGAWIRTSNGRLMSVSRAQKSDATKTTIRTGRLANAINIKGEWRLNRPATEMKFSGSGRDSDVQLFWIRPQTIGSGQGAVRVYLIRITLKDTDAFMKARLKNETGGTGRNRSGSARPFMKPAIDNGGSVFDPTVWRRMAPATEKVL